MLYSGTQKMAGSPALRAKAKRVKDGQDQFMLKHAAICTLRDMGDYLSHFLAKRLGQGRAGASWAPIHHQCMRLTITYRDRVWTVRVPVVE